MALYDDYLSKQSGLLDYYSGLKGTSTGLSEPTKSALTTQAMEAVPQQFDQTQSDLATSLLRRGGGLPSGGEFLRSYAPLQAEKIRTQAGLLRDVTLADEAERRRTGDLNNQYALNAAGQYGSTGLNLKSAEDALAEAERNRGFTAGQNELNRQNNIRLAELQTQGPSFGKLLGTSALSAAFSPYGPGGGLVNKGIDALAGLFGGGAADAVNAAVGPALPGPENAAGEGGGLLGGLGKVGTEIGTLGGLLPLAAGIPVLGGIAAGAMLLPKLFGQGRRQADKLTGEGGLQYNFNKGLADIVSLEQSGQITHEQRNELMKAAYIQLLQDAQSFASQGSNQAKVVDQMRRSYLTNPVTAEALQGLA